jgi:hypothetical protein
VRRSQLARIACTSASATPRGRANRRRPVTGSAAWDKSVSNRPSRKQKRKNDRSPNTKFWAVATDTDADILSTAADTSAEVISASPAVSPARNRRAWSR